MTDLRRAPVHVLRSRPVSAHGQVLITAWSQRIMRRCVSRSEDVLLEASAGLLEAGITSAEEQARHLLLPGDLTEFLIGQLRGMEVRRDVVAEWKTSTVYRLQENARLLGRDESAPTAVPIEYTPSGWPRRILEGTRGRRSSLSVRLILPTPDAPTPAELGSVEIVSALRRQYDGPLEARPISPPIPVLLCAYVSANAAGEPTVLDPATLAADADLSAMARNRARSDPDLERWLRPPEDWSGPTTRLADARAHLASTAASLKGGRIMGDRGATDLAHATRDALAAAVDQIRQLLDMGPATDDGMWTVAAGGQIQRSLRDDVFDVVTAIRRHAHHPRISRIDPTEVEAVAALVFGAQADLNPVYGRDHVEAVAATVVERATQLLELVDSLEVKHGEA